MVPDLIERQITPVMLSEDNKEAAENVAKELGIKYVHSELLPEDKETIIQNYQKKTAV